jgi:adenylosuccinate lyase
MPSSPVSDTLLNRLQISHPLERRLLRRLALEFPLFGLPKQVIAKTKTTGIQQHEAKHTTRKLSQSTRRKSNNLGRS